MFELNVVVVNQGSFPMSRNTHYFLIIFEHVIVPAVRTWRRDSNYKIVSVIKCRQWYCVRVKCQKIVENGFTRKDQEEQKCFVDPRKYM